MKPIAKIIRAGGIVTFLLAVAACSQQPRQDLSQCQLSGTNNIDRLFAEVSDKLKVPACHYSFPRYRERLLLAAKGSPGQENEARFAGLLRESVDIGIISKRQAQETFSRYFDPEFYVVKVEPRSSCSSLRKKDALYAAMREELAFKREGMLEILDDEARFRQAQHHYNDLNMVFEAVSTACEQSL
ncbi:MAG: hypothetical protein QNI86_08230 [Halieaceae bacterium]|nr:hypothetical protein [Halieaceae bacterium]